jgi:hypothetical protein
VYLKEGTYHTRLFRGPSTNGMKKWDGPSSSWPTPHTTPLCLPPEDPSPVLLSPNSVLRTSTRGTVHMGQCDGLQRTASHSVSHITAGLLSVLDLDHRGGRLFQHDNETIILIDCNCFTSEQIDCLQTVYPQLQATLVQSDASVTGFLIIFQMTSPTFKRAATILTVHVILFACGLSGLWFSYSKTSTV